MPARILLSFLMTLAFWTTASAMPEKSAWPVNTATTIDVETIQVLALRTAQTIALAQNPTLAAARARVEQARERVTQALAAYYPSLDADVTATRLSIAANERAASNASADLLGFESNLASPEDRYQTGLTATWTLFDGFARKFRTLSARHGEQQSQASLLDSQRLLLSSVALGYFAAQLARENITIAEADAAFNQELLTDAEARQRVGTGTLSEALNFQVRVNQARTDLIRAQRTYATAMIALATLLGIPEATFPTHLTLAQLDREDSRELTLPPAEPLINRALHKRPDIYQVSLTVDQIRADVEVARSRFYPTIALSGSVNADRDNSARFEQDDFNAALAAIFTYNLFSGGEDRARLAETRQRLKEFEHTLDDLKNVVTSEVRQTLATLRAAQEELVLQRSNTILVQRTRDLVEKGYRAGQESLVRLNEAQRDLTTARGRLALALVSLRQAWYDLKTATGENLAEFALAE